MADSHVPSEDGAVPEQAAPRRPSGERTYNNAEVLKVSNYSRPSSVAGAIAGVVRDVGSAEVQSIGAVATNQAIKAVVLARIYLEQDGIDVVCVPSFIEVALNSGERTAIRLLVQRR